MLVVQRDLVRTDGNDHESEPEKELMKEGLFTCLGAESIRVGSSTAEDDRQHRSLAHNQVLKT